MLIGLDLATKNCGWCKFESPNLYTTGVFGITTLNEGGILKFSDSLATFVSGKKVFCDFSFTEIYFPGNKLHGATKYFLAGVLYQATEVEFVSPQTLREFFEAPKLQKKEKFHQYMGTLSILPERSSHEIDAYLLALYGYNRGLGYGS